MAQNYVEVLIKARDSAKPELDDLRARLDELKHTVAEARANVNDEQGAATLDRLFAKLVRLDKMTARPNIDLVGALKTEAELHAVAASMDRLKEKTDKMKLEADATGGRGLIGKLLFGAAEGGGSGIIGSAGSGLAGMGPMWQGLLAALPVLLPELVAVGSGFAAAGAGAGAFYLLAHPAISNLTQDVQQLNSANEALQLAQNKYAVDPTKANAAAVQKAADTLKAVRLGIGQDAGGAASGIEKLRQEYDKLTAAFAPDVFKVFNAGLAVLNNLLPLVTPFARTFADVMTNLFHSMNNSLFGEQIDRVSHSVHGLVGSVATIGPSPGFQAFLDQFHRLEGPALQAIGDGIGKVAAAFAKLLTSFSGKDVANGINILFGVVAGAINAVTAAVNFLKWAWDKLSQNPTFKKIAGDISQAWASISTTGKKKPDFSGLTQGIHDAVMTAYNWLYQHLAPLIDHALRVARDWLNNNAGKILYPVGKALISGLIQGIIDSIPSMLPSLGQVAKFIAEHKGPIDKDRLLLVPHGQAIMDGLMNGMASRMPALRGDLAGITGAIGAGGYGTAGAGGGTLRIQLELAGGDSQFMTALANAIRVRGGDPRILNKKVAFQ